MAADEARTTSEVEERLAASRAEFLGFVRSQIADPELAEDVLQAALLRAVESAESLRDADRVVPWFYQILRNAIVDAYRRRVVQRERAVSSRTSTCQRSRTRSARRSSAPALSR